MFECDVKNYVVYKSHNLAQNTQMSEHSLFQRLKSSLIKLFNYTPPI